MLLLTVKYFFQKILDKIKIVCYTIENEIINERRMYND